MVLVEIRAVIRRLVTDLAGSGSPHATLLDVGCSRGGATADYAAACGAQPSGVEIFAESVEAARRRGMEVAMVDLESERLPFGDQSMDIVIANQVFEHLKNVWLPLEEIFRVMSPGGHLIFSVPNLASVHNRLLLLLGRQPSSIRTLGPHVRGFTYREAESLIGLEGAFHIERRLGVGFYPLSPRWARALARLWPRGSHTIVLVARKTRDGDTPWAHFLSSEVRMEHQTHY
jgi:2-polyprenyl-3-methyl-5-hydroxy-6-metoxy-1,4-benzoquinol methylase